MFKLLTNCKSFISSAFLRQGETAPLSFTLTVMSLFTIGCGSIFRIPVIYYLQSSQSETEQNETVHKTLIPVQKKHTRIISYTLRLSGKNKIKIILMATGLEPDSHTDRRLNQDSDLHKRNAVKII
jgi:hypothetical protein